MWISVETCLNSYPTFPRRYSNESLTKEAKFMCYTQETKNTTYVLHEVKNFSIPCVTHEELFGCLDALHLNTTIISI